MLTAQAAGSARQRKARAKVGAGGTAAVGQQETFNRRIAMSPQDWEQSADIVMASDRCTQFAVTCSGWSDCGPLESPTGVVSAEESEVLISLRQKVKCRASNMCYRRRSKFGVANGVPLPH